MYFESKEKNDVEFPHTFSVNYLLLVCFSCSASHKMHNFCSADNHTSVVTLINRGGSEM